MNKTYRLLFVFVNGKLYQICFTPSPFKDVYRRTVDHKKARISIHAKALSECLLHCCIHLPKKVTVRVIAKDLVRRVLL